MGLGGDTRGRAGPTVMLACVGVFVMVLDITIVSVALPRIGHDLQVNVSSLAWVVNAYTIVVAGVLLVCGRLIANYGPAICYVVGISAFGLASLGCGLAPDFGVLVAARAVQGLAAALVLPATITLITTTHPAGSARAKALGMWSAVGAIGGSSGTTAGGILTQLAGWRWVFLVNVPITGALAIACVRVLARPQPDADRRRLDLVGSALTVIGLATLVYAVLDSSSAGWSSRRVLGCLVIAALALTGFWFHQHRWARDPLIPLGFFEHGRVAAANASMFFLGLGFFATSVVASGYLQDVDQWSPLRTGLALLPTPVGMFSGAQLSGRLLHRFGVRMLASTGGLFVLAGFLGFTRLGAQPPYWPSIAIPLALVGFGAGVAFTPITAAANDVPTEVAGVAAGLLNTIRQVATALGLATLTAIAVADKARPGAGYAHAFLFASVAATIAIVGSATLLPRRTASSRPPSDLAEAEVALTTGALIPGDDLGRPRA